MRDWEESYAQGQTPWDTGQIEPMLVWALETGLLKGRRILEIGSGTGVNARYLADRGWEVIAIDISSKAIEIAEENTHTQNVQYFSLDFFQDPPPAAPFDAVFDRGVFHMFADLSLRLNFATKVAQVLNPLGRWLSLMGSTEGAPRDTGPPRRTASEIIASVEPALEVIRLERNIFTTIDKSVSAWIGLFGKREMPAQPSSPAW